MDLIKLLKVFCLNVKIIVKLHGVVKYQERKMILRSNASVV
jgi:hypothetical protein